MLDITYLYLLLLFVKMFVGVWAGFVMLCAAYGILWAAYKVAFSFIFGGTPNDPHLLSSKGIGSAEKWT
mgnify:CR=1 FL=1